MTEKNYWLHRISNEWDVSYPLLEKGYLVIGWAYLAASPHLDDFMRISSEKDEAAFDQMIGTQIRSRKNLWRFFRFAPGDIVVVPLFDGKFRIFEVIEPVKPILRLPASDAVFKSRLGSNIYLGADGILWRQGDDTSDKKEVDIGFFVRVRPLTATHSRNEYADSVLTARMKMRQTNGDINDINLHVDEACKEEKINVYGQASERLSRELLNIIEKNLDPNKFERLIQWYFDKMGASSIIPAKNEAGKKDGADVDVIATFEALKTIYYIQAKKHNTKSVTDAWAVDQITLYDEQKRDGLGEGYNTICWVISTCESFNNEATAKALEANVRLMNGIEFAQAIIDCGIEDLNTAFETRQ